MPHARTTDPETSHKAAQSITPAKYTETQRAILTLLTEHPLTDEEINFRHFAGAKAGRWKYASDSGLRSRRRELVDQGLVVRGGMSQTKFGKATIVWRLADEQF